MNISPPLPNWRFAIFSTGLLFSACTGLPGDKGIKEDLVTHPKPSSQPTYIATGTATGTTKPSRYGSKILDSYTGSYALLIGESQYTNGWSTLESIPGELQKVEEILQAQGFTVEKAFNLNKRQLTDRFEKFIDRYGFEEDNRLLFFYSGHGYTRDDKGYIVPVNAPNPNFNEKGFLRQAVGMNQVLTWARRIESKHVLFLFDSCFSGTVFKAKDLPEIPRQITDAAEQPVRQFITAGSAEQKVPAKSVFTPAFVDALRYGWGDLYKDGYITGQELGLYLKNKVPQHTQQTPQYGTITDYELSRGDFVFVVGGGKDSERDRLADTQAEQARIQAEQQRIAEEKKAIRRPKIQADGKVFRDRLRDGSSGPEMVWIPAGTFRMGDIQGGGYDDEKPVHTVSVKRFAMGKYEVTFAEYDKFAQATSRAKPDDEDWGRGNRPVINVSWDDAVAYAEWLSQQTGHQYRLPTEAEWEYAARAGTSTKYWWGNDIGKNRANCDGCGSKWDNKQTASVGSFAPNPSGLYDTVGNVYEWICSIYQDSYQGAEQRCASSGSILVLRGGSWFSDAGRTRSASRSRRSRSSRDMFNGFRLARNL